jgi:2-hydroxy-3-keto-5-methylthiopentenyl-1-phosphate phosphatase
MKTRKLARSLIGYNVFFDFDNTIATIDVLDDIIQRFSINKDWVDFERRWVAGAIGSAECLRGQLNSVRVEKTEMARYLKSIKLDMNFKKILKSLKKIGVEPIILSDNFSVIIGPILKANGINGLAVYANQLEWDHNRLIPSFPHTNKACKRCANCKRNHVLKHSSFDKINTYIGDGLSDFCAAKEADLVFAKDRLLHYCTEEKIPAVSFADLGDVLKYLRHPENYTRSFYGK